MLSTVLHGLNFLNCLRFESSDLRTSLGPCVCVDFITLKVLCLCCTGVLQSSVSMSSFCFHSQEL